jgi:hypothetical protein
MSQEHLGFALHARLLMILNWPRGCSVVSPWVNTGQLREHFLSLTVRQQPSPMANVEQAILLGGSLRKDVTFLNHGHNLNTALRQCRTISTGRCGSRPAPPAPGYILGKKAYCCRTSGAGFSTSWSASGSKYVLAGRLARMEREGRWILRTRATARG